MTLLHSIKQEDGSVQRLDSKQLADHWACHRSEYFKAMGMKVIKIRDRIDEYELEQGSSR